MFGEISGGVCSGAQYAYSHGGEDYIVMHDGELYNAAELRRELALAPDCPEAEIFARAYIKWREACVDKFNGGFALAVYEKSSGRLFFARDKLGVKALFYSQDGGRFIFASDIRDILGKVSAAIDAQSVAEIILIGPGRTPGYGIFKNIAELEPGCCGVFEGGSFKLRRYWSLGEREHTDNFEQTAEKVRGLVLDAITRRLDRQACTLLSGGLDSSLITSVAAEYFKARGLKLHAFSVDYKDSCKHFKAGGFQPESDGKYIGLMKDWLGSEYFEHHQVIIDTGQLVGALYAAVDARGLPGMADIDASLLLLCGQVRQTAPVALSGEGADEIFGGYPWFRGAQVRGFPWSQSTGFRKAFFGADFAHLKDTAEHYVISRAGGELSGSDDARAKRLTRLNLEWFGQTLLERQNRMGAAAGLNIRAPFCDWRIAEYLYNVPWEYKDYNNTEKGLLRAAVRGLLPDSVLWRKKSPYPKTHNPAYLSAVSKLLAGIINEGSSPLLRIADRHELANLIALAPDIKWYGQLMNAPQVIAYFVQLNYWLGKYKVRII